MSTINESLKSYINRDMVLTAATALDEKEFNISSAVSSIIPSLLAVMLKKGVTPQIKNILEEAGRLNIISGTESSWDAIPTENQQRVGDDFLQHLLGDKAADFTDPIADKSGTTKVATNRLVSMIAPIVAGYLGNKLVKEDWTLSRILKEIDNEKHSFIGYIPSELISSFGLASTLDTDKGKEKKSSYGWVIWVVLIALLLMLFFWWRSCRNNESTMYEEGAIVTDTLVQAPQQQPTTYQRDSMEITLTNGQKISVYKGGTEEEMIKYLQSEDYKKASDNDLKEKWFEFDNIAFEFGSSTALKPESKRQVNNIISILKNYKDAKIKIAGFADKKGTEEANMKVSQERAKTIESLLEKGGIGAQVVKTEGYGDEYAKHSAKESDEKRSEDRDIALRFVK